VRRREFIASAGGAAVALHWPLGARPKAAGEIRRIGFLRVGLPPPAWIEALRQGLSEFGYIEGRDIAIEFRLAESVAEIPAVVVELVRLKVDVIVASGTPPVLALAAGDAAGTIPVVFVAAIDPVATGLVASLARPQGNITGLTNTQADITGKQIQLLKELLPNLSSIGVLVRTSSQAKARYLEEAEAAAESSGLELKILSLRDPSDVERVFTAARGVSAVVLTDDAVFTAHRAQIAELARKNRIPVISSTSEFAHAGGLMSYGPNTTDLYRRAASYLNKILKGVKPADLPVEQPTKLELVVNLLTAEALGIAIPPSILLRADELIE
jgi:putative ABC transport system substrate-binding protein